MSISITFHIVKNTTFRLQADPSNTVRDLKRRIAEMKMEGELHFDFEYKLVYRGNVIPDNSTISTAGISPEGYVIIMPATETIQTELYRKRMRSEEEPPDNFSLDRPHEKKRRNRNNSTFIEEIREDPREELSASNEVAFYKHGELTNNQVNHHRATEELHCSSEAAVGTPFETLMGPEDDYDETALERGTSTADTFLEYEVVGEPIILKPSCIYKRVDFREETDWILDIQNEIIEDLLEMDHQYLDEILGTYITEQFAGSPR